MMRRTCTKCGERKIADTEHFHRSSRNADGLRRVCKTCQREINRIARNSPKAKATKKKYRELNAEKFRQWNRDYRLRNKGYETEYSRKWRKANPEKARAHRMVWRKRLSGKMIPQPCEVCGSEPTHAHHDDYSKPLEVRWLCNRHHADQHTAIRKRSEADHD